MQARLLTPLGGALCARATRQLRFDMGQLPNALMWGDKMADAALYVLAAGLKLNLNSKVCEPIAPPRIVVPRIAAAAPG
jgi:hypothetical protein